jgi:carbonic anhydrase
MNHDDQLRELVEANRTYASRFGLAGLSPIAARRLAIVTCIDTRIEPLAMLGLAPGDAKIIRNAGGRVTDDVLRSLALAVALLGVETVVVMHHTGCALGGTTDDALRSAVREAGGRVDDQRPLGAMPSPDAAMADDVAAVRSSELLPSGVSVVGWIYDVETGLVAESNR